MKGVNKTYSLGVSPFTLLKNIFRQKKDQTELKKTHALKNINLIIKEGEKVGLIGSNGSGKSTLVKLILGVVKADPNSEIMTSGRVLRLELGLGFDKELNALENIDLSGTLIGIKRVKLKLLYDDIIDFAELNKFKTLPIKYYSKGMKMRLAFSIAMYADADILLLDEFLGGGGDLKFKIKSQIAFKEKVLKAKTVCIVSHSFSVIEEHCTRVIWIEKGELKMSGGPKEVCDAYRIANG